MKKHPVLYLILALVLLATIWPWMSQGVPATDDFRHHLTKFWWVHENVNDFQYNEWQPSIYSGWPLTQFYHSLPYFILLPFNFLTTPVGMLKLNMVAAMIFGVFAMLYASKKLTNNDQTAIIATIFYALAPIHFEFAYFSGSISRQWAYVFVPLALALFIQAVDERKLKTSIYAAIAYAALMWTHLNVAYALALIFALYLIYTTLQEKKLDKNLMKQMVYFSVVAIGLISFWLIPLATESAESEASNRLSSVFGNAPPPAKASLIFLRGFGMQPEGRYFYIGLTLLLLAAASLLAKYKHKNFFAITSGICLLLTIFTLPLKLLPYLLIDYSIYFTLIALVPLSIMAAYGARGLAKLTPQPALILLILVGITAVDLYPAITEYNWVEQSSDNFVNPPQLIEVWREISKLPGDFRVHSPLGQVPFMYHKKYEVGTTWMGFREGALKPIRQITDQFEEEFKSNPLGNKSRNVMEYFGVQHLVLQCNPQIEQTYPLAIQGNGVCSYRVNGAPLVSPITTLTRTDEDILQRSIQPTEAVIVEPCQEDCSLEVPGANITNINWQPESISFQAQADSPALLIVRSAYFSKRHNAYINNEPAKITQVWPKYMLIEAPKGTSTIEIKYESNTTHYLAKLISLLTLLIILYLIKKN